jgi:protein-disulfide isomerase
MRAFLFAAAFALAGAPALAAPVQAPGDMAMGNPKAKVEVIEYASVACPHCAHFNEIVIAPFTAKWVNTGKVHFVLKEMLTASPTVAMAGFLVARCAGPGKYFKVVDEIYRSQPQWQEGRIKGVLQRIAAENGMDEARFNACLQDQAAIAAVNARNTGAQEQDGVDSTPTVFVNGRRLDNLPQTPEEMDVAIAAAMPKPGAGRAVPGGKLPAHNQQRSR